MGNVYKIKKTNGTMINKKLIALSLTFLVLSIFLINLGSSVEPFDIIKETFSKWGSGGGLGDIMARGLLAIIVFLLISVGLSHIPSIGKQKGVVILISAIIAFIATAYFTPQEITAILTSYTALGLTVSTILPFLILAGFTYNAIKQQDIVLSMLSQIAWGLFALYGIYRFGTILNDKGWEGLGWPGLIVGVTIIIAAGAFIFQKSIRDALTKRIRDEEIERFKDEQARTRAVEVERAEATKN